MDHERGFSSWAHRLPGSFTRPMRGPGLALVLVLSLCLGFGAPALQAQSKDRLAPSAQARAAHQNCHMCHGSHQNLSLLRSVPGKAAKPLQFSKMDSNCLLCHQGPAAPMVDQGASKLPTWTGTGSSHIDGPFLDRAKSYARVVDLAPNRKAQLKSQCTGCHDPHAKDRPAYLVSRAFDAFGKPLKERPTTVAQICFACHAGFQSARSLRTLGDVGALFRPEAVSAHRPGAQAQKRQDLPSLRAGLFKGTLDCTSCHDNPNPAGPRGPHGSTYPHLLKAPFGREGDVATFGSRGDDLCLSCHDRTSILGNQSFPWHAQHIGGFTAATRQPAAGAPRSVPSPGPSFARAVGRLQPWAGLAPSGGVGKPTACATCHDGHGSTRYPALMAFDTAVVSRASVGVIDYQRTGLGHGSCTLSCHGYDHVQTRY